MVGLIFVHAERGNKMNNCEAGEKCGWVPCTCEKDKKK